MNRKFFKLFFLVLLLGLIFPSNNASAKDLNKPFIVQSPRFILYFGRDTSKYSDKIISQENLAKYAFNVLDGVYKEYTELFGRSPKRKVTLRFLSPFEFKRYTGAPEWTSAMYFNDEITIPLNPQKGIHVSDLGRAIRHEYAHAVIAELSSGKCPAWLDEGLAQLLEGKINPLLGPALRKWISNNDSMPLSWLENGFTLLDDSIVPAAYAQSLFATRIIIKKYGYEGVSNYLNLLNSGHNDTDAFSKAFNKRQKDFNLELTKSIREWAKSSDYNP